MLEFVLRHSFIRWKIRGRFEKNNKIMLLAVSEILDLELLAPGASAGVTGLFMLS